MYKRQAHGTAGHQLAQLGRQQCPERVDVDPAIYREHILPKLATVKLAQIGEATGYSKGHNFRPSRSADQGRSEKPSHKRSCIASRWKHATRSCRSSRFGAA